MKHVTVAAPGDEVTVIWQYIGVPSTSRDYTAPNELVAEREAKAREGENVGFWSAHLEVQRGG